MALKRIAVLIDPTLEGDDCLRLAATIAKRHGASLTGFYVVQDTPPFHSYVRGHSAIQSMIERCTLSRQWNVMRNSRRLSLAAALYKIKTDFRVIWNPDDLGCVNSLPVDLLIVGDKTSAAPQSYWRPEQLVSACAVPLLVAPARDSTKTTAESVLIAWNGSKEARRATTAAMPFLKAAQSVTILMVDSASDEAGLELARHLASHGVRTRVEQINSAGASTADVILSNAAQHHADLIVMGAYSHARPMRLVFGGITRSILRKSSVPILMSR
jgi:nucleotide-binding universal stress UspA family protein